MRTRRGLCYPKLIDSPTTATATATATAVKSKNYSKIEDEIDNRFSAVNGGRCPFSHRKLRCFEDFSSCKTSEKIDAPCRKRAKVSPESCDGKGPDFFDSLPDDIVVSILAKLTSSASCPADFINALITCKRFNGLALNSVVLSKASPKIFAIKAQNWCESAHKFLKLCSDSGNVEASYCLGMVINGKWRLVRFVLLLRMQTANHLLLDVLGKHRDKYHDLLFSDCRKQITDALMRCLLIRLSRY